MLYEPSTFFGCVTLVRKYEVTTNTDGLTDSKKYRGCFFYVQNEELRNAFDTYRKIENLASEGFKTETEQIRNSDTSVVVTNKKKWGKTNIHK